MPRILHVFQMIRAEPSNHYDTYIVPMPSTSTVHMELGEAVQGQTVTQPLSLNCVSLPRNMGLGRSLNRQFRDVRSLVISHHFRKARYKMERYGGVCRNSPA